jgi:hypothetical protein
MAAAASGPVFRPPLFAGPNECHSPRLLVEYCIRFFCSTLSLVSLVSLVLDGARISAAGVHSCSWTTYGNALRDRTGVGSPAAGQASSTAIRTTPC